MAVHTAPKLQGFILLVWGTRKHRERHWLCGWGRVSGFIDQLSVCLCMVEGTNKSQVCTESIYKSSALEIHYLPKRAVTWWLGHPKNLSWRSPTFRPLLSLRSFLQEMHHGLAAWHRKGLKYIRQNLVTREVTFLMDRKHLPSLWVALH